MNRVNNATQVSEICRYAIFPTEPYRMLVSARRLFSQVEIWEPSAPATHPSPHKLATSSRVKALITSVSAACSRS